LGLQEVLDPATASGLGDAGIAILAGVGLGIALTVGFAVWKRKGKGKGESSERDPEKLEAQRLIFSKPLNLSESLDFPSTPDLKKSEPPNFPLHILRVRPENGDSIPFLMPFPPSFERSDSLSDFIEALKPTFKQLSFAEGTALWRKVINEINRVSGFTPSFVRSLAESINQGSLRIKLDKDGAIQIIPVPEGNWRRGVLGRIVRSLRWPWRKKFLP